MEGSGVAVCDLRGRSVGGLTLIFGNELLNLGGVAVAVGVWFLANRHDRLQGFLGAVHVEKKSGIARKNLLTIPDWKISF